MRQGQAITLVVVALAVGLGLVYWFARAEDGPRPSAESGQVTETPAPETPAPETPAPETPAPETPEATTPETADSETAAPDTAIPDTADSGESQPGTPAVAVEPQDPAPATTQTAALDSEAEPALPPVMAEEPAQQAAAVSTPEAEEADSAPASPDLVTDPVAESDEPETVATQQAALPDPATDPATDPVTDPVPAANPAAEPGPAPESRPLAPSFDIIRVEPRGATVIAGRAEPGSVVTVYDEEIILGRVVAGPGGDWVFLADSPLAPGSHALRLHSRTDQGTEVWSDRIALIAVPHPAAPQVTAAKLPGAIQSAPASAPPSQSLSESDSSGPATGPSRPEGPAAITVAEAPTPVPAPHSPPASSDRAASSGDQAAVVPAPDSPQQEQPAEPLVVLLPSEGEGASEVVQGPRVLPEEEGIKDEQLSLETVDYDEEGNAIVSGSAEPGSKVVVYLDDEPVAEVQADEEGKWPAKLDTPITPGVHDLRVDQVNEQGLVVAQIITPFAKAEVTGLVLRDGQVIVQPGNSLWRIARRIYGRGVRYTVIYQANSATIGEDPDLIYPGQIFTVPETE